MQPIILDGDALQKRTAEKLSLLATLRGVTVVVEWDGAQYTANGEACGPSAHGVTEWLERQPGVKP